MAEILAFQPKNAAINPDVVLQKASGEFESVIVLGWNKDGMLDFRVSLNLGHADVNWLLALAQKKLLNGDYSV